MEQIDFEPLVIESPPPDAGRPPASRFGAAAVVGAVAATLVVTISVLAGTGNGASPENPPAARSAVELPPPAAEPVARPRPTRHEVLYSACMTDVGGSPDAQEQWVESCRRAADEMLHDERIYAACMTGIGGSADSMERYAAECRRRAGLDRS